MEIKVTFRFDASDKFMECVERFSKAAELMSKSGIIAALPEKENGVTKAVVTPDGVKVNKKEVVFEQTDASTKPQAAEKAEAVAAAEPPSAEKASADKTPTEADVREAMHRTRQRIEGEDYKENPGEGYEKWHKKLTSIFKNIAAELGSDKPSTLPEDKRANFISQCDEIITDGDELTVKLPF